MEAESTEEELAKYIGCKSDGCKPLPDRKNSLISLYNGSGNGAWSSFQIIFGILMNQV